MFDRNENQERVNCEKSEECLRRSFPVGRRVKTTKLFADDRERTNRILGNGTMKTHEYGMVVGYGVSGHGAPTVSVCTVDGLVNCRCKHITLGNGSPCCCCCCCK